MNCLSLVWYSSAHTPHYSFLFKPLRAKNPYELFFSGELRGSIRVVMNTAYRMVYPFLVIFARGLGLDISVISGLIGNRAIIGVANPFLFPFIETRGRKFGMLLGVGLFILGMGMVALYPSLTTLGISLVLGMLSKSIFDPSLASYVADHVAYEKAAPYLVSWNLPGHSLSFWAFQRQAG